MELNMVDGLAFASTHFDDFSGDGLDGNGTFGVAIFEVESQASGCPRITPREVIVSPTHFLNRSAYERGASSDLQTTYDPESRSLFMTGEQRVRLFELSNDHRATELADLDLPEVVDVALDLSFAGGRVLGLANGNFLLVEASTGDELSFAGEVETPGNARVVAPAGDGRHFFVGDSKGGIAVIEYGGPP
jgi:hypothetical protein